MGKETEAFFRGFNQVGRKADGCIMFVLKALMWAILIGAFFIIGRS